MHLAAEHHACISICFQVQAHEAWTRLAYDKQLQRPHIILSALVTPLEFNVQQQVEHPAVTAARRLVRVVLLSAKDGVAVNEGWVELEGTLKVRRKQQRRRSIVQKRYAVRPRVASDMFVI